MRSRRLPVLALLSALCCRDRTDPVPVAVVVITSPSGPITFRTLGRQVQFTAEARDAEGRVLADRSIYWTKSDSAVVLYSSGLVTAYRSGTAMIRAWADGTGSAPVMVTVDPFVVRVALTPDTLTFHTRARSQAVTIEVQDSSGAKLLRTPTLTILDTTVARFSSGNNVLGVADGITRLVGAVDGVADTAVVRVDIVPARIVPTPATLAIGSHAPRPVRATVTDSLSQPMTGFTFAYTSSDTSVITVSGDGEVTPHAEGTAQLRIEAAGLNAVVPITVRYVLAGVVILPNPLTFYTLNRPQRARLYSIDSVYTVLGLLADTIPGSPRRIKWAAFGSWYTFVPADTGVDVYPIWSYEDGYQPLDASWLGTFEGYASIIVRLYAVTCRLEGPKTDLAVGESTLFTRVLRDSLDNDLEGRVPFYLTNQDWSVVTIEDGPNPWTISVRALQPGSSWIHLFAGWSQDSVLVTVH